MKATVWVDVLVKTRVLVEVRSTPEDVWCDAMDSAKALVAKALDHDDVEVAVQRVGEPDWDDGDDHDAKFDAHHEGGR